MRSLTCGQDATEEFEALHPEGTLEKNVPKGASLTEVLKRSRPTLMLARELPWACRTHHSRRRYITTTTIKTRTVHPTTNTSHNDATSCSSTTPPARLH